MTIAAKFIRELSLIERNYRNLADSRLLDGWRARAAHAAAAVFVENDRGAIDPTEVYQFNDRSLLVVGNPRQEWYPVTARETARYSSKNIDVSAE